MALVMVSFARAGMRIEKDVFSNIGIKLLSAETVLTNENIRMLRNHNVQHIEVSEYTGLSNLNKDKAHLLATIKKVPLFAGFTNEQLAKIIEGSKFERRQAHEMIFRQMDPGTAMYVIVEGSVKIFTHNHLGAEKILTVFKAGDAFGELSLLDGKQRSTSAQTLEDTRLVSISRRSFMNVIQSSFDLVQNVMKVLARRITDTEQHLQDLVLLDARSRVVKSLVLMSNRFGRRMNDLVEIKLSLDYNELAELAGVNREEIRDVLDEFERRKILITYSNYIVMDMSKLLHAQ